jgi:hypothetical protein
MCIGRETGGDEKWRGTLIPAIGTSPGIHDITESDPPVLYNFSGSNWIPCEANNRTKI